MRSRTTVAIWAVAILIVVLLAGLLAALQFYDWSNADRSGMNRGEGSVGAGPSAMADDTTPQEECMLRVNYFLAQELHGGNVYDEIHLSYGRSSAEYIAFRDLVPDLRTPAREWGVEQALRDVQPQLQVKCADAETINAAAPQPRERAAQLLTECERVALSYYEQYLLSRSDRVLQELIRDYGFRSREHAAFQKALSNNTAHRVSIEWGAFSARAIVENDVATTCGVGPLPGPDPAFPEEYPGQDMAGDELLEEIAEAWGSHESDGNGGQREPVVETDPAKRTFGLLGQDMRGSPVQMDALCDQFEEDAASEIGRVRELLAAEHGEPIDAPTIRDWYEETCSTIMRLP